MKYVITQTSAQLCSLQGIPHQYRDSQQSNPARHRSAPAGYRVSFQRMNIADQRVTTISNCLDSLLRFRAKQFGHRFDIADPINADIDYRSARFDVITPD